jgi:hypothetical protein
MYTMAKLPYGRADFASIIRGGYYYVDRTGYIPLLEALGESYLIFLRPRRFGKSLWLSTLAHYYGREHAGAFPELFGHLAAGQLEQALETGRAQLRRYFRDPELQAEPNLRAWLAVFAGTRLEAAEEVLPAEA